jgi:Ca2+-binding RTX toxin-like protein
MVTRTLSPNRNIWPDDWGDDNSNADNITGTNGRDLIFGGLDNDQLDGLDGDDLIWGGHGDDQITGKGGNDYISAGDANDTVTGGPQQDILLGDEGDDDLDGGTQNDIVFGGTMNDTVKGGDGADELYGQEGQDSINGGEDVDRINGGLDKDVLTGGPDNDRFIFTNTEDSTLTEFDEITDFDPGDRIDLSTIDANASAAGNQAFNGTIIVGAGPPVTLAVGRLYYDTTNQDLYGNATVDQDPDFRIHVGVATLVAADIIL